MHSLEERVTWPVWSWFMKGPNRYGLAMAMVKLGVRLAPFLPWHPGKLGAWTRGRALPDVPPEGSFRAWWRRNGSQFRHPSPTSRTENQEADEQS